MPRPQMPDGLYVSVSQLKCFLQCPRKYDLKYVRGEAPAFVPVALAFGTAIHAALAAFYGELHVMKQPLRRDLMLDVFREVWSKVLDGPVPLQVDEDDEPGPDLLVDRGVSMLHVFHEYALAGPQPEVKAVERPFEVPICDPVTGEILEEQLVGVIDLVIMESGRHVIVEHKTAAKKYNADQLRYDLQPTAYALAARQLGLGDVGLRYQVLTKTKVPAVQTADVRRDEQDEGDFLSTVVGVLRAIDAGVSYPVRGWACRTCPYREPCTRTRVAA